MSRRWTYNSITRSAHFGRLSVLSNTVSNSGNNTIPTIPLLIRPSVAAIREAIKLRVLRALLCHGL